MKRIEKLIVKAIQVVSDAGIADKDLHINKEFKGYIASFGAGIIQSGLLPAVIFYENEESGANVKRELIPKAILLLLKRKGDVDAKFKAEKLSTYIMESRKMGKNNSRLLKEVTDAAIALKIAMRTFSFEKVS